MKALDTIITVQEYENSPVNKGGLFKIPLGVLRNFGIQPGTETPQDLERVFKVYWQSSFDDINAFNPDRPLNVIQFIDLKNAKADRTIQEALILQVNELLKNGLVETKSTDQNSTGAFSSSVSPNVRIISPDQISQDVEDKLGEVSYKDWRVQVDEENNITVTLQGERLLVAKTANLIALSSLVFEGLDNTDIKFLGENAIIKIVRDISSQSRSMLGTWDAPDVASVGNIDALHANPGLTLTDGSVITPANTDKGDTILVKVSTDASWKVEELSWDGSKWIAITNNNLDDQEITAIKGRLLALETGQTKNVNDIAALVAKVDANKVAQDAINQNIQSNVTQNTQEIANVKGEQQLNSQARIRWEEERADYVRVDDLAISTPVQLNGRTFVEDAADNTYTMNLGESAPGQNDALDLSKFVTKGLTVIKGLNGNIRIKVEDSYNDGSTTPNTIRIGENDIQATLSITQQTATLVATFSPQQKAAFLAIVWEEIEQISAATSTIDDTARNAASAADVKATNAQQSADGKVAKQLSQGDAADFETLVQLKALVLDDDMIALTLASGIKITGRVSETGSANPVDPMIIDGTFNQNNIFKIGKFTIDTNFNVTGGFDLADLDQYEKRVGDYTNSPRTLTFNETNGKRFQIIDQPAGEDKAVEGVINKLIITNPNVAPQDADQVTYGSQLYWIKKPTGDIVNWSEIKVNVAAGKIMIIKNIGGNEWELVGWEDKPGWKDITATYKTRDYSNDLGKRIRVSKGTQMWILTISNITSIVEPNVATAYQHIYEGTNIDARAIIFGEQYKKGQFARIFDTKTGSSSPLGETKVEIYE